MEKQFMDDIKEYSKLHDMAENTGFIKRLLEGNATVETYGEYLYNLYEVYHTIEVNLEKHKENKVIKNFALPEIYRSDSLMEDLKFLLGDKLEKLEPLMSTKSFMYRMYEISETNPELIIAHAYTRYLADLFGGRTIYSIVKNKYNIDEKGLNYYQYEDIPNLKSFVMEYHGLLNNIKLDGDLKCKFLSEVNLSYIYNISISNELEYNRFYKQNK